jgi:hypothetical protein
MNVNKNHFGIDNSGNFLFQCPLIDQDLKNQLILDYK